MQKLSLTTSHKLANVRPVLNSGYFERQYLPVPTTKLLLFVSRVIQNIPLDSSGQESWL